MVLQKILMPKRDEVVGEWRILHNEELHDLYPSPNTVRVIKEWDGRGTEHVWRTQVWWWNPEGKRPLGRFSHRWVDILKWIFK